MTKEVNFTYQLEAELFQKLKTPPGYSISPEVPYPTKEPIEIEVMFSGQDTSTILETLNIELIQDLLKLLGLLAISEELGREYDTSQIGWRSVYPTLVTENARIECDIYLNDMSEVQFYMTYLSGFTPISDHPFSISLINDNEVVQIYEAIPGELSKPLFQLETEIVNGERRLVTSLMLELFPELKDIRNNRLAVRIDLATSLLFHNEYFSSHLYRYHFLLFFVFFSKKIKIFQKNKKRAKNALF